MAAAAMALPVWVRRSPPGTAAAVRIALAVFLFSGLTFAFLTSLPLHGREWVDILPLHLCDFAVLVAVFALLTRNPFACEVLWFWATSGTVLALLMPDVGVGYPDARCVSFFALHGAVVASAAVLVFGAGCVPRPRADLRVLLWSNAYLAIIAVVDFAAGENFMYLRAKPTQPSLLDGMGPWPWYIVSAELLAFVLFRALMLPFRSSSRVDASAPVTRMRE